ncbi:MAG: hypothetical protein ABJB40_11495 [Acidobacteriota bacterium]
MKILQPCEFNVGTAKVVVFDGVGYLGYMHVVVMAIDGENAKAKMDVAYSFSFAIIPLAK